MVLVGSGQGGECLVCSTFYLVLGQGLAGVPGAPGGLPPPNGNTFQAILSFFWCPGGRNGGSSSNENAPKRNCESSSNESGFSAPLGAHSGHFARRGPPGGEIVSRLQTKSPPFGFGTRLRTRAVLTPLFGAIWANWPEWVPRGAIELLSLEDDSQFQFDAFSFEDDS